jgi:hypothetical protein
MRIIMQLTESQARLLQRPVNGAPSTWGGFQRLLVHLQERLQPSRAGWMLCLDESLARQVVHYSQASYGPGGFQERIRPLAPFLAAVIEEVKPPQRSLFSGEPAHAR